MFWVCAIFQFLIAVVHAKYVHEWVRGKKKDVFLCKSDFICIKKDGTVVAPRIKCLLGRPLFVRAILNRCFKIQSNLKMEIMCWKTAMQQPKHEASKKNMDGNTAQLKDLRSKCLMRKVPSMLEFYLGCSGVTVWKLIRGQDNPNLNVCTGRGSFWLWPLICRTSLEAFLSLLSAASSWRCSCLLWLACRVKTWSAASTARVCVKCAVKQW